MVHKIKSDQPTGSSFLISSCGTWLSGSYSTERAAKYALRFSGEQLNYLTETICVALKRDITFEDLQAEYKRNKKKKPIDN